MFSRKEEKSESCKGPDSLHQNPWFLLLWKGELNSYRSPGRRDFSSLFSHFRDGKKISKLFVLIQNIEAYFAATAIHTYTPKDLVRRNEAALHSDCCEWAKARERTWRKKKTRMQHKTKNTIDEKSYSWNSSRQVNICLSTCSAKNSTHKYIRELFCLCSLLCMPVNTRRWAQKVSLDKK